MRRGEIHVKDNWKRLTVDLTYYWQKLYILIIDYEPERAAILKEIRGRDSS